MLQAACKTPVTIGRVYVHISAMRPIIQWNIAMPNFVFYYPVFLYIGSFVSDIAVFVLKSDVKLEPTNRIGGLGSVLNMRVWQNHIAYLASFPWKHQIVLIKAL